MRIRELSYVINLLHNCCRRTTIITSLYLRTLPNFYFYKFPAGLTIVCQPTATVCELHDCDGSETYYGYFTTLWITPSTYNTMERTGG